ncbi:hypothetical protein ACFPZ0_13070 [Streptomonospora nanhaiensis]|uniref:hypothetical protein n=1 Tax=Streptomonospora nanhaiensis TaxID=1323731 RepID=UPI001C99F0C4|nr:hypothetical protein [Streptomonospora nanhaiensis]MBX9389332.1 hypothetical protein [Streptomonospora nanhaiensis]
MPTNEHEAPIEFVRNRPDLAVRLLQDALGVSIPEHDAAELASENCTDLQPKEYRADAVVSLKRNETPVLAVVVEVQLKKDANKRFSWPVYLTTVRARLRCPAVLLVLCPTDPQTASWAAQPFSLGHPGLTLAPLVLRPDQTPVVVDQETAVAVPELAVLSAAAHGNENEKALLACAYALRALKDTTVFTLYYEFVDNALSADASRTWEALVTSRTYTFKSEFANKFLAEGEAKGKAEGKAESILAVLEARGLDASDSVRRRITACGDPDQLDTWIRRAATVTSVADLFEKGFTS